MDSDSADLDSTDLAAAEPGGTGGTGTTDAAAPDAAADAADAADAAEPGDAPAAVAASSVAASSVAASSVAASSVPPGPPAPDYDALYDRAYGAILGHAAGDALALQVDGNDHYSVDDRYPNGTGIDYPYKGVHRGYPMLDWTAATDTAVLTMRTLAAYFAEKTDAPAHDLAHRLSAWFKAGYPELGDGAGNGCEGVTMRAVGRAGYLADPIGTAAGLVGPKAENGALIRALACAFTTAPCDWAVTLSEVTHADDRCIASAVTYAHMLFRLSRLDAATPTPYALVLEPVRRGRSCIKDKGRQTEFMAWLTKSKSLASLELDGRDSRTNTLKTLAVALWAFRALVRTHPSKRGPDFVKAKLREIAAQGGAASANCAVAGAVFGAALGQKSLPAEWLEALPNGAWLRKEAADFLKVAAATW